MKIEIKSPQISTSFKTEKIYPELENITITPTLEEQQFKSEKYGFDNVVVKAIDIKLQEKTITPTLEEQIIIADDGYDALSRVNVEAIQTEEINITPSNEEQTKEGLFNKVTVPAIQYETKLTTENPIPVSSDIGTVEVKIDAKNKFDQENWYNTLRAIKSASISKVTVNGQVWYKFWPDGIYTNEYMKGQFKENTQYTLSCKARKYQQSDTANYSSGLSFMYTDGTREYKLIENTLEEYDYILTSQEGKTIDYIWLPFEYCNWHLVRDIQLEEGTVNSAFTKFKDGQTYTFDIEDGDKFAISLS